jgi:hypothetical protein
MAMPQNGWTRRATLFGAGGLGLAALLPSRPTRARVMAMAEAPNLFELAGDGVKVTYSTSSIDGQPRLSYQDAERDLSFAGEEIITQDSAIGHLVTVSLETIPDAAELTLTLLVPDINLPAAATESSVAAPALLTTHHSSIGGPALVEGALQSYEVVPLEGTASLVDF